MIDPKLKKKGASEIPIGGMITNAGSSQHFHTGNWRSKRPIIDENKCINCLFCMQFCPENAVTFRKDGKRGDIDMRYCKGCGICCEECPANCIQMKPESDFADEKCVDECVLDKKYKI